MDVQPILAALDECRLLERPQVLRGVRQRETQLGGEGVDRPFALDEELENLKSVRAGERFPQASELAIEAILESPMRVQWHNLSIQYISLLVGRQHFLGSLPRQSRNRAVLVPLPKEAKSGTVARSNGPLVTRRTMECV